MCIIGKTKPQLYTKYSLSPISLQDNRMRGEILHFYD